MDISKKQLGQRVLILICFAVFWSLASFIGIFQTALLTKRTTIWITALSILYVFSNIVIIYIAYRFKFVDVLIVLGIFWLVGTIGMVWGWISGTSPAFSWFSVLPLIVGVAYGKISDFWNTMITLTFLFLFLGMPTACAVLSLRIWKKTEKTG